jgi:hypothetical protein
VQNNLAIGAYKGKHVALFRATDTVIDCGQGTIIDFPSWKAMREMLGSSKPEVVLSVKLLLQLAGEAEDELQAGLAEEVAVAKEEAQEPVGISVPTGEIPDLLAAAVDAVEYTKPVPPAKRPKIQKPREDPDAWLPVEISEYPNNICLVSSESGENYAKLVEEASTASCVGYDIQWAPDFTSDTDHPISILQLAFPNTGNAYVLQLPLLDEGFPETVRKLFESASVTVVGFCANDMDLHKFEITGVQIDRPSVYDVQPWCEAEMGENESVKQGWRVGLKRAVACVLDFEMDKAATIASSNWEREELTSAQVEYGAMDVWVALRLYQRLASVYKK